MDVTAVVSLALLLGLVAVVISLLGKLERIATSLEELAAARREERSGSGDGSGPRA
ncbi:hypothetical protein [Pseudokineococcus sp. 1T1Z-3]|uniref:hypothetical protein n=1 Tax=Pseudokineococcus sp. 1T1Z-3 TaxID=3132745 RepID=UPI0030A2D737